MIVSRITAALAVVAISGVALATSASAGVLPPRPVGTSLTTTVLAPVAAPCSFTVAKGVLTVHGRTGYSVRAAISATSVPAYQVAGHFYTSTWTARVPADATTAKVQVRMGWFTCAAA